MKILKLLKVGIVLAMAAFAVSCFKITDLVEGENGLVAVYLQAPGISKSNIPDFNDCKILRGQERNLCIAKNHCSQHTGKEYAKCHSETLVMLNHEQRDERNASREEKGSHKDGKKTSKHDDDGDNDNDSDDGEADEDGQDETTPSALKKIIAEVESVELYSDDYGWVKVGKKTDELDLLDPALNQNIGKNHVPSGTYTRIRVKFGDEPQKLIHNSLLDEFSQPGIGTRDDYTVYPLAYPQPESKVMIIEKELIIEDITALSELEILEVDIVLDMTASVFIDGEVEYFMPTGDIKGLSGGGYIQPTDPVNVTLDGGNVSVTAPAGISDEPVKITAQALTADILPPDTSDATATTTNQEVVLGAYEMGPSQVFNEPVSITMPYDQAALSNAGLKEENIQVSYFNEDLEEWVNVPSYQIDQATGKVTVHTNHFTIYKIDAKPGFRMIVKNGITAKIDYDLLNYVVDKLKPIVIPEINSARFGKSKSGKVLSIYSYKISFAPKNINTRSIRLHVNSAGTRLELGKDQVMMKVSILLKDIPIGRLSAYVTRPRFWPRSGTKVVINRKIDYTLSTLSMDLMYLVTKNPKTGSIRFAYHAPPANKHIHVTPNTSFSRGTLLQALYTFVVMAISNIVNNDFAEALLLNEVGNVVGPKVGHILNTTFAESVPLMKNVVFDKQGISYNQDLDTKNYLQNISDFSANCASPPNIPAPAQSATTPIMLTNGNHVGLGISFNAFNDLFTEFANRGFFCYNGPGNLAGDNLQVTPNGEITFDYKGNYTYGVNFPVAVKWQGNTYQKNFTFNFRLIIARGLRAVRMVLVDLDKKFSDSAVKEPLDYYYNKLQKLRAKHPSAFNVLFKNVNPAGYSGLHPTMFDIAEPHAADGRLNFQAKIEGFKYNYNQSDTSAEWVWVQNYGHKTDRCYPHVVGILRRPTTSSYRLELSNGSSIPLTLNGVNAMLLNSFTNKRVGLEGSCSGSTLRVKNVILQSFYTSDSGLSLNKNNYMAQLVPRVSKAYARTHGLYSVDVDNNGTPEILQILRNPDLTYHFRWYLEKNFTSAYPWENSQFMATPAALGPKPVIYRVSTNRLGVGPKQILINCTLFNINATSTSVALTKAYNYCSPPPQWTWMSGSNQPGDPGYYISFRDYFRSYFGGSTYSSFGQFYEQLIQARPKARYIQSTWSIGSSLWVFGGDSGNNGSMNDLLSDLWRYDHASGTWTLLKGSSGYNQPAVYGPKLTPGDYYNPSARRYGATTTYGSTLYLFGGGGLSHTGRIRALNDLWRYNTKTNQWTFLSGSSPQEEVRPSYGVKGVASPTNHPPKRSRAVMWISAGHIWLFGGYNAYNTLLNDLWKYNLYTNQWTWVAGNDQPNRPGVYGQQGVFAPQNTPGARDNPAVTQTNGRFYLHGGKGFNNTANAGMLNDLWVFNPQKEQWSWVGGSKALNKAPVHETSGFLEPDVRPGARRLHRMSADKYGNLWLFGGHTSLGTLNDLWKYDRANKQWSLISGSALANESGVYGSKGVFNPANNIGARHLFGMHFLSNNQLLIFGGLGNNMTLNDVWMFNPQLFQQ